MVGGVGDSTRLCEEREKMKVEEKMEKEEGMGKWSGWFFFVFEREMKLEQWERRRKILEQGDIFFLFLIIVGGRWWVFVENNNFLFETNMIGFLINI